MSDYADDQFEMMYPCYVIARFIGSEITGFATCGAMHDNGIDTIR